MSRSFLYHNFTRALRLLFMALILTALGLTLGPAPIVRAATIFVTNTNDTGPGSLRQAMTDAMATPAADTINFLISGTITLGSTLPQIVSAGGALTIDATGQTITISGNDAVMVFGVDPGGSLDLQNLTITRASGLNGGGIVNGGTLAVANCTFSANYANNGGGIYSGGILTVTNSTFVGNITSLDGAGINSATGTMTVTNSTFSGNQAGDEGGAIMSYLSQTTVTNCTLSGNQASNGGGIFHGPGSLTFRNTIVANSVGFNCAGSAVPTNGGYNIDDGTTCDWGSVNGSMSNTNPLLGALADNGGPTQTMALWAASPAIDRIPNAGGCGVGITTDQRGFSRPHPPGDLCDIGAYETMSFYLPYIRKQ